MLLRPIFFFIAVFDLEVLGRLTVPSVDALRTPGSEERDYLFRFAPNLSGEAL